MYASRPFSPGRFSLARNKTRRSRSRPGIPSRVNFCHWPVWVTRGPGNRSVRTRPVRGSTWCGNTTRTANRSPRERLQVETLTASSSITREAGIGCSQVTDVPSRRVRTITRSQPEPSTPPWDSRRCRVTSAVDEDTVIRDVTSRPAKPSASRSAAAETPGTAIAHTVITTQARRYPDQRHSVQESCCSGKGEESFPPATWPRVWVERTGSLRQDRISAKSGVAVGLAPDVQGHRTECQRLNPHPIQSGIPHQPGKCLALRKLGRRCGEIRVGSIWIR